MIKIAVIDDGISKNKIKELKFNIEIDKDCRVIECCDVHDNSHGTMCAMIIKKYAPDALLGSIKILKLHTKRGCVNQFKKAIEWCVHHDISLINISLGSTQSYDYSILFECVDYAYYNGIIMVAALSNKHVITYPASFKNVIGVETDPLLKNEMYYMNQNSIERTDIVASSLHNVGNITTEICNSYAAPLVTAKIYQIINESGYRDIVNIKTSLNNRSYKKLENYDPFYYPSIITNDIVDEKNKSIEIPCVMIMTENIHDNLLYFLQNKFHMEGYSTILITTEENDLVDISCHAAVRELNDKKLVYIASKYESDLIIICFDNINKIIPKVTCDLLFYQKTDYNDALNSLDLLIKENITYELKIEYTIEDDLVDFIYQKSISVLAT